MNYTLYKQETSIYWCIFVEKNIWNNNNNNNNNNDINNNNNNNINNDNNNNNKIIIILNTYNKCRKT